MSASVSLPWPFSFLNTPARRSVRDSNAMFGCPFSGMGKNLAFVHFVDGAQQRQDLVQSPDVLPRGQAGVGAGALEPGVDHQLFQLLEGLLDPAVAGRKAHLLLQLQQGGLAVLDGVAGALPGDAEVFPISLRERSSW